MPRRRDEGFANPSAFHRAHGNVLQVRIKRRQSSGHRRCLAERRVHAPRSRVHHLRQLVRVRRFELGQRPMLEQHFRQRKIGGELGQHVLVGRRQSRGGLAQRGKLHFLEQDLAELPRRRKIKGLARKLVRPLLQFPRLVAELATLRGEQRTVDHHSFALHAIQDLAHRNFNRGVDVVELRVRRDERMKMAMELQRDIGILGRIRGGLIQRDLVEVDLLRALARHFSVRERLDAEMPPREIVHVMRTVRFEHVRLEQRVVRDAGENEPVIGKHVLIVFEILAELSLCGVGEP